MSEKCGDCGEDIFMRDERARWENRHGQVWCKGPDGARLVWEQQHAPKGQFPVRTRKPEGQVCRCIAAKREHIHRLEILLDGAELGPN
jgi:hypothetical protein